MYSSPSSRHGIDRRRGRYRVVARAHARSSFRSFRSRICTPRRTRLVRASRLASRTRDAFASTFAARRRAPFADRPSPRVVRSTSARGRRSSSSPRSSPTMPSRASAWSVDDSTRRVVTIAASIADGASRKSRSVGRSVRVETLNPKSGDGCSGALNAFSRIVS